MSSVGASSDAVVKEATLVAGVTVSDRHIRSGEGDISDLGAGKLSRDLLLRLKFVDHWRRSLLGGDATGSGDCIGVINLEASYQFPRLNECTIMCLSLSWVIEEWTLVVLPPCFHCFLFCFREAGETIIDWRAV